jgi:hypothetical protein
MDDNFVSFITLQSNNCNIINIFVYTNENNNSNNNKSNMNKSNINSLDIKKYKRCNINTVDCSICYEKVKPSEYIRELNCNHIFHKKCIDKWLLLSMKNKENINCPICRTTINLK